MQDTRHSDSDRVRQLLQSNKLDQAATAISELCEKNPDSVEAEFLKGVLNYKTQNFPLSETHFRKYIGHEPTDPEAIYYLGLSLEKQGKPEDALKMYRATLQVEPRFRLARDKVSVLDGGNSGGSPEPPPAPVAEPVPPQTQPRPRAAQDISGDGSESILMRHLRRSNQPAAQEALAELAKIEGKTYKSPTSLALLGYLFSVGFGLLLILAIFSVAAGGLAGVGFAPIAIAIGIVALVFAYNLNSGKTRSFFYTAHFSDGRLTLEDGIVLKRVRNIELHRVIEVQVHRYLFDRVFGMASLKLNTQKHGSIVLRFIGRPDEARDLANRIRDLVLMLRSNPELIRIIE